MTTSQPGDYVADLQVCNPDGAIGYDTNVVTSENLPPVVSGAVGSIHANELLVQSVTVSDPEGLGGLHTPRCIVTHAQSRDPLFTDAQALGYSTAFVTNFIEDGAGNATFDCNFSGAVDATYYTDFLITDVFGLVGVGGGKFNVINTSNHAKKGKVLWHLFDAQARACGLEVEKICPLSGVIERIQRRLSGGTVCPTEELCSVSVDQSVKEIDRLLPHLSVDSTETSGPKKLWVAPEVRAEVEGSVLAARQELLAP